MHSDAVPGLLDRFNKIAEYRTGFNQVAEELAADIAGALGLLGFRHFAAITVNNFNMVQRTSSSFANTELFFGRDISNIILTEVLRETALSGGPVFRECSIVLNAPFDQVYIHEADQKFFGLFSIYRDQFTRGYLVVFSDNGDVLRQAQWRLQALAQLAVDAIVRLPVKERSDVTLSANEILVLKWTYEQKTMSEVAALMDCKERTANYYVSRALQKLEAKNKQHAAQIAKAMGVF